MDRLDSWPRWLPDLGVLRPEALRHERGLRIFEALKKFGVRLEVSSERWGLVRSRLRIRNAVQARRILVVEESPVRGVRRERFPHMSTRPDHYFGGQGMNCPYSCEYCYLYANSSKVEPLVAYANLEGVFSAIEKIITKAGDNSLVFNFGEDADSLAIEHLTSTAEDLIQFFAGQPSLLELRSKAGVCPSLLDLQHEGRTIIGISVNAEPYLRKFEHRTASLAERLAAMRAYGTAGYSVALKIEPGLLFGDWREEYRKLVRVLNEGLEGIVPCHASLGCLRYRPELRRQITAMFPGTRVLDGAETEYVPSRFSYSDADRGEFYKTMVRELRDVWPGLPIYLSMESENMCKSVGARPWLPERNSQVLTMESLTLSHPGADSVKVPGS